MDTKIDDYFRSAEPSTETPSAEEAHPVPTIPLPPNAHEASKLVVETDSHIRACMNGGFLDTVNQIVSLCAIQPVLVDTSRSEEDPLPEMSEGHRLFQLTTPPLVDWLHECSVHHTFSGGSKRFPVLLLPHEFERFDEIGQSNELREKLRSRPCMLCHESWMTTLADMSSSSSPVETQLVDKFTKAGNLAADERNPQKSRPSVVENNRKLFEVVIRHKSHIQQYTVKCGNEPGGFHFTSLIEPNQSNAQFFISPFPSYAGRLESVKLAAGSRLWEKLRMPRGERKPDERRCREKGFLTFDETVFYHRAVEGMPPHELLAMAERSFVGVPPFARITSVGLNTDGAQSSDSMSDDEEEEEHDDCHLKDFEVDESLTDSMFETYTIRLAILGVFKTCSDVVWFRDTVLSSTHGWCRKCTFLDPRSLFSIVFSETWEWILNGRTANQEIQLNSRESCIIEETCKIAPNFAGQLTRAQLACNSLTDMYVHEFRSTDAVSAKTDQIIRQFTSFISSIFAFISNNERLWIDALSGALGMQEDSVINISTIWADAFCGNWLLSWFECGRISDMNACVDTCSGTRIINAYANDNPLPVQHFKSESVDRFEDLGGTRQLHNKQFQRTHVTPRCNSHKSPVSTLLSGIYAKSQPIRNVVRSISDYISGYFDARIAVAVVTKIVTTAFVGSIDRRKIHTPLTDNLFAHFEWLNSVSHEPDYEPRLIKFMSHVVAMATRWICFSPSSMIMHPFAVTFQVYMATELRKSCGFKHFVVDTQKSALIWSRSFVAHVNDKSRRILKWKTDDKIAFGRLFKSSKIFDFAIVNQRSCVHCLNHTFRVMHASSDSSTARQANRFNMSHEDAFNGPSSVHTRFSRRYTQITDATTSSNLDLFFSDPVVEKYPPEMWETLFTVHWCIFDERIGAMWLPRKIRRAQELNLHNVDIHMLLVCTQCTTVASRLFTELRAKRTRKVKPAKTEWPKTLRGIHNAFIDINTLALQCSVCKSHKVKEIDIRGKIIIIGDRSLWLCPGCALICEWTPQSFSSCVCSKECIANLTVLSGT